MILRFTVVLISCMFCVTFGRLNKKGSNKIKDARAMICAIAKDEDQYIDEWLRYHKYLGFDHVYLHDNAREASPYLASLHQIYGEFVTVVPFPGLNQQRSAYLDCLDKFKDTNTWAAFIDVDEFIVLRKHVVIKDLLREVAPKGGAVVLNWSIFSNNGTMRHEAGLVTSRFTYTTNNLNQHIKTIAYLKHVKVPDVHNTILRPGYHTADVQGRRQKDDTPFMPDNDGNKNIAYINHYHSKSLEEYVFKKRRGRADMELGGPPENFTDILLSFEAYHKNMAQVEDTFARDFYLRHYFGNDYKDIFKKADDSEADTKLVDARKGAQKPWWWLW